MPTVAEIIAARLSSTGMDPAFAARLTALILDDLREAGYGAVQIRQVNCLVDEMIRLESEANLLLEAGQRLQGAIYDDRLHTLLNVPKGSL